MNSSIANDRIKCINYLFNRISVRRRINRRGSIAVETSIFLPLLIIAVLTLGYIIRLVSIEERVFHSFADETHLLAAQGYIPTKLFAYPGDVESRIIDENKGKIDSVEVSPYLYAIPYYSLNSGKSYTSLIAASVSYEPEIPLISILNKTLTVCDTILCRSWTGMNNKGTEMPFSEMEEDKETDTVWIFPRSGEKYHKEDCSYIKNNFREMFFSKNISSNYNPCKLCKPNAASYGTLVYCFPQTGEVYHLGSCYVVDRYVIPISSESAKGKGYSACSKCGG